MRVASRVIGVVLALTGLGFLALPAYVYALGQGSPDAVSWIVIAVGVGCLLAARYFLKLDVDALDDTEERPASRFALYFIAHRRELKLIALVGFAISLIRLGAACYGVDWPGRWANWVLPLTWAALLATPGKGAELKTDGGPALKFVLNAGVAAFWILLLLLESNHWLHLQLSSRIVQDGILVLLFAWEVLFFQYGARRAAETPGNILKS
jgi:hypothetical protein